LTSTEFVLVYHLFRNSLLAVTLAW